MSGIYTAKTWTNALSSLGSWTDGRWVDPTGLQLQFATMSDLAGTTNLLWEIGKNQNLTDSSDSLDGAWSDGATFGETGAVIDGSVSRVERTTASAIELVGRDVTIDVLISHIADPGSSLVAYLDGSGDCDSILRHRTTDATNTRFFGGSKDLSPGRAAEFGGAFNLFRFSYEGTADTPNYSVVWVREDGLVNRKTANKTATENPQYTFGGTDAGGSTMDFTLCQVKFTNAFTTADPTHNVFEVGDEADGLWPYSPIITQTDDPGEGLLRLNATFSKPTGGAVEGRVRRGPKGMNASPTQGPNWSPWETLTTVTNKDFDQVGAGPSLQAQLRLTPESDTLKTGTPVITQLVLSADRVLTPRYRRLYVRNRLLHVR